MATFKITTLTGVGDGDQKLLSVQGGKPVTTGKAQTQRVIIRELELVGC